MKRVITGRVMFAAVITVLALIVAAGVAVAVAGRRDCRAEVRAREGQRVMWLYLLEQNPSDPRASAFRIVLDGQLPALECHGSRAVPVE